MYKRNDGSLRDKLNNLIEKPIIDFFAKPLPEDLVGQLIEIIKPIIIFLFITIIIPIAIVILIGCLSH